LVERVGAEAANARVSVAIAMVDVHGNLVLQHRMNGAPLYAIRISKRKAQTSTLVRMRTPTCSPSGRAAEHSTCPSPRSADVSV
jgi:uncharacterized protein GlcG (DUF336 family)